MTTVAPSVSPIINGDLVNAILKLPDDEFWKLVSIRLNLPLQQDQIIVIDTNEHIEYWTKELLIEKLFLRLACTKQTICHNYKSISVYKYYRQALELRKWIPIAKPAPAFIINISDLTSRIIAELKILNDPRIILKQAAGRIFENIDPRQYHLSIARSAK